MIAPGADAPAGGRQLYVYYRVAPADLAHVVAGVLGMQARLLARHPGLAAQLMQRVAGDEAATGDVALTLMETYTAPQGIDAATRAAIEAAAAALPAAARAGERHVECFEPCPALPCPDGPAAPCDRPAQSL